MIKRNECRHFSQAEYISICRKGGEITDDIKFPRSTQYIKMTEVVRIYLLGEIISILIWYFIPPIFFRMRNKQKRIKIMQEYILRIPQTM